MRMISKIIIRSENRMLRFRLKELLADREFREGRVITLTEVARATGVHRMTLSKVANHRGYNPTADVLDKLCDYFGCRIEQLVEHVPQGAATVTARRKTASQRSK